MMLDPAEMISVALEVLRIKLHKKLVGFNLVPVYSAGKTDAKWVFGKIEPHLSLGDVRCLLI